MVSPYTAAQVSITEYLTDIVTTDKSFDTLLLLKANAQFETVNIMCELN